MQGQAVCLAFLFPARLSSLAIGTRMTEKHSLSRQKAEIAFSNIQTQFFAKNEAVEELESCTQSREEKTLRLREARLAKELKERVSVTSALLAKRARAK
jgi:hypothetical protein